MGRTMIEKIFARHTTGRVEPGEIIWLDVDVRSARDFAGANVVKNFRAHYGDATADNPHKTFFTFDCNAPANTIPYANNQMICRTWAQEQGIRVFDVDAGIGTHVLMEKGLIGSGVTAVGTDSHFNILGALGAFGQGMGDTDMAFIFKTGRTWFEVPATMKVTIEGSIPPNCTPRDLTLAVLGVIGSSGALGLAIEFSGDAIDTLPIEGRITLCSQVTEMGGITGLCLPNEDVHTYLSERGYRGEAEDIRPDEDASYVKEVSIDLSDLQPLIARPGSPTDVVPVSEVAGRRLHSIFIGSCTNGRTSDIRLAASILKGRKVYPGVMLKVVPATREVYGELLSDGTLAILYKSGAIVSNPGCGGCAAGQIGMTGKGEVTISTTNRNYRGKQGDGDTYLAGPHVAAWSAIEGKITEPAGA